MTADRKHKRGKPAKAPTAAAGFRRADLAAYLARTPSGIDKLLARGEIPKPVMIGRTPFWPKYVIDEWLAERVAA